MYVHVDVLLFSVGKIILNSYAILTGFITELLVSVLFQEIPRIDKSGKRKWFSDVEK